jgi:carboxymethylenebutenolidase
LYDENDERLTAGLPDLEERMSWVEVGFSYKIYPNFGHAFFNDSNSPSYNQAASTDAWKISLDILTKASLN